MIKTPIGAQVVHVISLDPNREIAATGTFIQRSRLPRPRGGAARVTRHSAHSQGQGRHAGYARILGQCSKILSELVVRI
jgi:hypothetical protein